MPCFCNVAWYFKKCTNRLYFAALNTLPLPIMSLSTHVAPSTASTIRSVHVYLRLSGICLVEGFPKFRQTLQFPSSDVCAHRRFQMVSVLASISRTFHLTSDIYESKYFHTILNLIFIGEKNPIGAVVGSYNYKFSGIMYVREWRYCVFRRYTFNDFSCYAYVFSLLIVVSVTASF